MAPKARISTSLRSWNGSRTTSVSPCPAGDQCRASFCKCHKHCIACPPFRDSASTAVSSWLSSWRTFAFLGNFSGKRLPPFHSYFLLIPPYSPHIVHIAYIPGFVLRIAPTRVYIARPVASQNPWLWVRFAVNSSIHSPRPYAWVGMGAYVGHW